MPTYQYRCKQCGDEFEKVQSFSDDSTPKCPNCGTRSKKNISKVFGAVGISFKGSGFYKNDHTGSKSSSSSSSSSSSTPDSSSSDSSNKSESKSEGKSEKKPEKKSEAKATSSD